MSCLDYYNKVLLFFLKTPKILYFICLSSKFPKHNPHWAFCFGFSFSGLVTKQGQKWKEKKGRLALCFSQPFSLLSWHLFYFPRAILRLQKSFFLKNCIVEVPASFAPPFNLWFDFIIFEYLNVMVYNKDKMPFFLLFVFGEIRVKPWYGLCCICIWMSCCSNPLLEILNINIFYI